jgi:hypothetical protein
MQHDSIDWSTHSLRWIADRNPFYLLSACCGLLGCWLLASISRQDLLDVALRIAGVVAYEVLAVCLGVWLAKNASMLRDAAILSVLTLILIADFSFFYTQAAMLSRVPAVVFTLFGCAQALGVMGFLLRGYRVNLPRFGQWLLAVTLFAVHLVPLAMRWVAEHSVNLPLAFLAAFAATGVIVGAHASPWRERPHEPNALARALGVLAPAVMLLSLLAHLIAVEWIYDVQFMMVFASPLFLGLAWLCLRTESSTSVACMAAGFAVLLALGDTPPGSIWDGAGWSWLGFSPLRAVLIVASLVFMETWLFHRSRGAFVLGAVASFAALLGHTRVIIGQHLNDLSNGVVHVLSNLMPVSREGWGLFLFSLAFVLLAAGAWLSSWKTRDSQ